MGFQGPLTQQTFTWLKPTIETLGKGVKYVNNNDIRATSMAFICLKSTIETLEKGVKRVQS